MNWLRQKVIFFSKSPNLDLYLCLSVYALRLILNFSGPAIFGTRVFWNGDTIWWFGAFHYFVSSVVDGVLPYWNPYSHGGEPFYFLYSMYRLLDPAMIYPLIMAKLTSVDLLTIYHQYYLLREWLLVFGYLLLSREFTPGPRVRLLSGLMIVLAVRVTSQYSMLAIDALSWTPWITYFAITAYRTGLKSRLYLTAFFTGILIGPSSYHFLYFMTFALLAAAILLIIDFKRLSAFFRMHWGTLGACALLVFAMSLPVLSIFLDKTLIFPVARAFGGRDVFLQDFLTTGKFTSAFKSVFQSSGLYSGNFLSFSSAMWELAYFGRTLGAACLFFATLGYLSLTGRFQAAIAALVTLLVLFAMADNTPVYYYIYSVVPILQMIRHTAGFVYCIDLIKFPLIGIGISYLVQGLSSSSRPPVKSVIIAFLVMVLGTIHVKAFNWQMIPVVLLLPLCFMKSIEQRLVRFYQLVVLSIVVCLAGAARLPSFAQPENRMETVTAANAIYPTSFQAEKIAFDSSRILALPRPGWILFESMILHKNTALSTVLEPPKGKTDADIPYLKLWKDGVVGNRTIYWPTHYLEPYLIGESNVDAFFDIMGIGRDNVRFYKNNDTATMTDGKVKELFLENSRENLRVTDSQLTLAGAADVVESELLKGPTAQPTNSLEYEVQHFDANRIVMSVNAREPGHILYNDIYDPHWKAKVNGQPTEIQRANLAFKSVGVGAGQSTVEFRYEPRFFMMSVWIYLICLGFGGVLIAVFSFRRQP